MEAIIILDGNISIPVTLSKENIECLLKPKQEGEEQLLELKVNKNMEKLIQKQEQLGNNDYIGKHSSKYYVVIFGKKPGIYNNWLDCKEQINEYSGSLFKSFKNKQLAYQYLFKYYPNAILINGIIECK